MDRRKIIMDCSLGMDDAWALAYAAGKAEALELLGISTVNGRQTAAEAAKQIRELAEILGLKVPVAAGTEEQGENAVSFMSRILKQLPQGEQATLVLTGPMTNAACLLKLFPEVKERIQEIIFAGGAACGGNVTPAAEFNIYTDPDAAKLVLDSGVPLVMCGLDATYKCCVTRRQVLKMCQSGHRIARLLGDMAGREMETTSAKYRGVVSLYAAAPFLYMTNPEIFTPKRTILDVDCSEGISRGSTVCDFRWWEHEEEEMNSLALMDADTARFQENMITAVYELSLQEKE